MHHGFRGQVEKKYWDVLWEGVAFSPNWHELVLKDITKVLSKTNILQNNAINKIKLKFGKCAYEFPYSAIILIILQAVSPSVVTQCFRKLFDP